MGHIKPKRKVCYQTADGVIHKSKKEADFHIHGLVSRLQASKHTLKSLVDRQKKNKKDLARTLEFYRMRLVNGYDTTWEYVKFKMAQIDVAATAIRYAHRNIEAAKNALRGK